MKFFPLGSHLPPFLHGLGVQGSGGGVVGGTERKKELLNGWHL